MRLDELTLAALKERCDVTDGGCWEWRSPRTHKGYGLIGASRRRFYVHRLAYEFANGPIPAGLQIDHLCRVRHCMNPAHLEAVTPRENVLRSIGPVPERAHMTHCPRGHEFTAENTYSRPDRTSSRMCRACCQLRESRRVRGAS